MTVFTFSLVKDIPLDKRIAVMVSGGWDSAVMWYMVNVCNAIRSVMRLQYRR
jgi:tRNA(Ile)-lysidine synthase TilS/MesJ